MTKLSKARIIENNLGALLDHASTMMIERQKDPMRYFALRPSGFPYCGLRRVLDAETEREKPRLDNLAGSYFTGVGTTTHSVFQEFIARTGKVVGDWRCYNPKCKHWVRFTIYQDCPKCGHSMEYMEIEVRFRNTVVGHLDGLVRLNPKKGLKSEHIVVDYKTTGMKRVTEHNDLVKRRKPTKFPYLSNVHQLEAYVPMLETQYGINITYWALIYLARDAPFKYGRVITAKHLDDEHKERLLKQITRSAKVHRKVLKAHTLEQFQTIQKYKLCKSRSDYDKNYASEYNPCPHLDQCFGKEIDKKVKALVGRKVFPLLSWAPPQVYKELGFEKDHE